jgi:hypothetical protein
MKDIIKPLTDAEKDRLYEIQFYLFVRKLLEDHNKSVLALDIMESLGSVFNCNSIRLKRLVQDVYMDKGIIVPTKKEMAILFYKEGLSVRRIYKLYHIHQQTLYRYLEEYIEEGQFEYVYKTEDEDLVTIKRFMIQLEQLINWR